MNHRTDRRAFLGAAGAVVGGLTLFPETADGRQKGKNAANGGYVLPSNLAMYNALSLVFGRAGDRAITANLFAQDKLEAVVEYGTQPNKYSSRTPPVTLATGQPLELAINCRQQFHILRAGRLAPGTPADERTQPLCQDPSTRRWLPARHVLLHG